MSNTLAETGVTTAPPPVKPTDALPTRPEPAAARLGWPIRILLFVLIVGIPPLALLYRNPLPTFFGWLPAEWLLNGAMFVPVVALIFVLIRISRPSGPVRKTMLVLGSLRVTVVVFALSMVLVFCGTLAQKDASMLTVVGKYFRSFFVWIELRIFFPTPKPPLKPIHGSIPFPGGWLIGAVLLVNVLAAHIVRFRYTWKRLGIVLTHAGIILLMSGELITGLFAVEANLTVLEGSSCNYLEERDKVEFAVVDTSDPNSDRHIIVPENVLKRRARVSNEELPFDLEVIKYMSNSDLVDLEEPDPKNLATTGYGLKYKAVDKKENAGADSEAGRDLASAYVRLLNKETGQEIDTHLVSILISAVPGRPEQKVQVGDKTYTVSLRFKRVYKPYTVSLLKFDSDYYPGTSIPKNYSSLVHFTDSSRGVDTTVLIKMNQPLRYQGETFFQADWTRHAKGTVLQVVRNPGWLLPYVSCTLVAIGLLMHFGMYLMTFLQRRAAI